MGNWLLEGLSLKRGNYSHEWRARAYACDEGKARLGIFVSCWLALKVQLLDRRKGSKVEDCNSFERPRHLDNTPYVRLSNVGLVGSQMGNVGHLDNDR